jgi:hypothetical protein
MANKNSAGIEKIFIVFALTMVLISTALACDLSNAKVELSQNKVCAGDKGTVILLIAGSGADCKGVQFTVNYYADVLDNAETTSKWSTTEKSVELTSNYKSEGTYAVKWNGESQDNANLYLTLPAAIDWSSYTNLLFSLKSYESSKLTVALKSSSGAEVSPWAAQDLINGYYDLSFPVNKIPQDAQKDVKSIHFYGHNDAGKFTMIFDNVVLQKSKSVELAKGIFGDSNGVTYFDIPKDVPPTGTIGLRIDIQSQSGFFKTLNVVTRPSPEICYSLYGDVIDCAQACTDVPFERRWELVQPSSLPMHFTFATATVYTPNLLSADIGCTNYNDTYGLYKGGIDCCSIPVKCGCKTCAQLTENGPFWRPYVDPNKTVQNAVYGGPKSYPTGSSVSKWSGIYYEPQADGTAIVAPPNSFADKNINAPEFYNAASPETSSGCNGTVRCDYETHNVTRYTYEWTVDYDVVTTAYSKKDYVPMYVGYGQKPSVDATNAEIQKVLSGPCEDGNLCYTEVPFCGDGVCDTAAGERCWNCEKDCGGGPNTAKGWLGNCTHNATLGANWWKNQYGGCSRCPLADADHVDPRGCIIKYKQEGETCNCNVGECGWGNPDSNISGSASKLECITTNLDGSLIEKGGRCCHSDEVWDPNYQFWDPNNDGNTADGIDINKDGIKDEKDGQGACVVPREIEARDLQINKVSESSPRDWVPTICCGSERSSASWLDVTFTIENQGKIEPEKYDASIKFYEEKNDAGGWGNFWEKAVSSANPPFAYSHSFNDVKAYPGSPLTGTGTKERVACAFTSASKCDTQGNYMDSTGKLVPLPQKATKHSLINITIKPDDIAKDLKGHNYPSMLEYSNLSCDTGPNPKNDLAYCSNGQTLQLPAGTTSICGGWTVWNYKNKNAPQISEGIGVRKMFGKPTWVPTWNFVDGIGCYSTKPKTSCPCRTCLVPFIGLAAYALPCFVDCSYNGC